MYVYIHVALTVIKQSYGNKLHKARPAINEKWHLHSIMIVSLSDLGIQNENFRLQHCVYLVYIYLYLSGLLLNSFSDL